MTITPEMFELQIHKVSTSQLKDLLKNIYELKWNKGKMFSMDKIMDIERKETKIVKELMRRGYLTKRDQASFQKFLDTENFRKKVF